MSYSVLSCVSLRFYPLSSGIVALVSSFRFSAFSGFPSALSVTHSFPAHCPFPLFSVASSCLHSFCSVPFSPSAPFPSLLLAPVSFSLPSLSHSRLPFCLFSLSLLSLAPLFLAPLSRSSLSLLSFSLPSTAPPLLEPDRRTAGIYFAAAFLVVAFLAAGFLAVFASAFTAVLAGDFRAAGSFSTFASALTALLRVVFFFGSGVPALRA